MRISLSCASAGTASASDAAIAARVLMVGLLARLGAWRFVSPGSGAPAGGSSQAARSCELQKLIKFCGSWQAWHHGRRACIVPARRCGAAEAAGRSKTSRAGVEEKAREEA